jgi:hypothetical protein
VNTETVYSGRREAGVVMTSPEKWTLVPIECSARAALMRPTRKSTILGSPMVTQIKSIGMVLSWNRRVWVTFLSCPVIQNTKFSAGANCGGFEESSPSGYNRTRR